MLLTCNSKPLKTSLDLLGHQLASLFEEVVEAWYLSVQHALRQAAHPKIGPQLLNRRDAIIKPSLFSRTYQRKLGLTSP